jgi:hypothetical protein
MTLLLQTALFLLVPDISEPKELSPLQILQLVGFATGAALHLYLCLMVYRRYGLRSAEIALLALGLSTGLWHLGNFAAAIHELLVGPGRAEWWLKGSYAVAYTGLAFMPPVLSHAHFRVWEWIDKRAPRRHFKKLIIAGYLPLLFLPSALNELLSEPYRKPIDKLAPWLVPFILWFVVVFAECAAIDWRLACKWPAVNEAARERRFFEVFGTSLAVIGALFLITYVFGARHWGEGEKYGNYLDLIARLSSLAPKT